MLKQILIAATVVMACVLFCLPALCSEQEEVRLTCEAFVNNERPGALFDHDVHNENAKLEDCGVCHHSGENGVRNPEETSEGTPCAECHQLDPVDGTTSLQDAYHGQCITCHESKVKGPLACGECHKR